MVLMEIDHFSMGTVTSETDCNPGEVIVGIPQKFLIRAVNKSYYSNWSEFSDS